MPAGTAPMTGARIGWKERLGWASGDIAGNFYWKTVSTFLYFYYTEQLGISPFWAGIAFGIGTFWDGLCDPVIGAIADRTRTRFGRFRPYLLYLSLPAGISFVLMFWKPPIAGDWLVAYAIVSHILFRTISTAMGVAYGALSARMATDSDERGLLAALRMFAAAIGSFVPALLFPQLLAKASDPQAAYLIAATVLAVGATAITLFCFFMTRETVDPELDDAIPPADGFREMLLRLGRDMLSFWSMLRHNVPLRLMMLALMVSSIMSTMADKMSVYWYKYDLQNIGAMSAVLPAGIIPFLLGVPFWTWLSRRLSKGRVWIIGTTIGILGALIFYAINPRDVSTLIVLAVIGAFSGAASVVMFWAMLPDTVEYNEWVLGERAEARIFGVSGIAQKSALAVNAVILGQALEWIGYVPGRAQTPETLEAMLALMCLVPALGGAISIVIMWRYPLTAERHREIIEKIRARAAGGHPPTPHAAPATQPGVLPA